MRVGYEECGGVSAGNARKQRLCKALSSVFLALSRLRQLLIIPGNSGFQAKGAGTLAMFRLQEAACSPRRPSAYVPWASRLRGRGLA